MRFLCPTKGTHCSHNGPIGRLISYRLEHGQPIKCSQVIHGAWAISLLITLSHPRKSFNYIRWEKKRRRKRELWLESRVRELPAWELEWRAPIQNSAGLNWRRPWGEWATPQE